jgi:hypothetical protein
VFGTVGDIDPEALVFVSRNRSSWGNFPLLAVGSADTVSVVRRSWRGHLPVITSSCRACFCICEASHICEIILEAMHGLLMSALDSGNQDGHCRLVHVHSAIRRAFIVEQTHVCTYYITLLLTNDQTKVLA